MERKITMIPLEMGAAAENYFGCIMGDVWKSSEC